jgi:GT2 family glycosyltransferase/glycosyltransferase involved in cell wall biosynthesis
MLCIREPEATIPPQKVGIVMVSYNAHEMVRMALASVRQAATEVDYELMLVDNASRPDERAHIASAMAKHTAELGWRYVELPRNLGFAAGNNVGIRRFLADPSITHVCLLNSDVLVSDGWIDRLLHAGGDLVSAVTHRADSEQAVPIDYTLDPARCLDAQAERVEPQALARVAEFARRRAAAWRGHAVDCDVTFFCVVLGRAVFADVGLLDETFFPGGYEDDDYCLRARAAGKRIVLARDVYLHHWGSGSFGALAFERFNAHAAKNRAHLEAKHGLRWRHRAEKPLLSYTADLAFALRSETGQRALQRPLLALHERAITAYIDELDARSDESPASWLVRALRGGRGGALNTRWASLRRRAGRLLARPDAAAAAALLGDLDAWAQALHAAVERRLEASSATSMPTAANPAQPVLAVPRHAGARLRWFVRRGWHVVRGLRGIVFFGGYCYAERESDGYFQRIRYIDSLFRDRWRIYIESAALPGRARWYDVPEPRVLVLRVAGSRARRVAVGTLAILAALRCRKVYFHSVLRMREHRCGWLLHLPWLRKAVDLHGAVAEEFRLLGAFHDAVVHEREEFRAARHAGLLIAVTQAMQDYFRDKIRRDLAAEFVVCPVFPAFAPRAVARPPGRPVVVYAGGLQRWQQVPKMLDAIARTIGQVEHRLYCSEPQALRAQLAPHLAARVVVESKSHEALVELYDECHFGFVLRDDGIVNRVACPTKLVEYIAAGIVPIVDSPRIGDFAQLGLECVGLDALLDARLPDEAQRLAMARRNLEVYAKLRQARDRGAEQIVAFFGGQRSRTLPAPCTVPRCDVLVQVENFEAGGLENVVLDINEQIVRAGWSLLLLVHGSAGAAVERARAAGCTVICRDFEAGAYRDLLRQAAPRVVFAHYALRGVDECHALGVPFVQVIHNLYLWFDAAERERFARAARLTWRFIAVSQHVKDYSVARLAVDPRRCDVVHNGVAVQTLRRVRLRARRDELRARQEVPNDAFVFLDVGAINHQKNHLATVRAFAQVVGAVPSARLLIVGPCYERELLAQLHEAIAAHELHRQVRYLGAVSTVHDWLELADAFVTASFFEGFSLAIAEAVVANVPVVAPALGWIAGMSGRRGFELVAPDYDFGAYRGSLTALRSTPRFERDLAQAMIRVARAGERPDLSEAELQELDSRHAYAAYLRLIRSCSEARDALADSVA